MNIPISVGNEEIRLTADERNFEIRKLKIRKNKDGVTSEEWQPVFFYSSLENALNRILSLKISTSTATSLSELKADIEKARHEICSIWGQINPGTGTTSDK